jgi:signal transduction histidine kinase
VDVDSGLKGYWDHNYLRRALENLCTNAVKYGRDGTKILISAHAKSSRVFLSVHNDGNALTREDQDRLFVLFSRGKSAEASGKHGWGLGLTIVKGVAEAHGGTIEVASTPQAGTAFTMMLPLDARSVKNSRPS